MNRNNFYKIHTIDGDKYLKEEYTKTLYDYYRTGGIIFKYEILITEEEFDKLIEIINEKLKEKLTEEEIKKALIQYIQIIMSDARDNKKADINYFIKCTDYLALDILNNTFLKKAKPLIKNIKKELTKELNQEKEKNYLTK